MKKKLLALFMALVLTASNCMITFAASSLPEPPDMADAIPTATGTQALAALGDSESVVLDIRSAEDYNQAHIKGSVSNPVCRPDFSVTTDERDAFIDFAQNNISTDQKIYLICYVGGFCVNHAAKWLIDAGYSSDNLYRVTGGVWGDTDLSAACNTTNFKYAISDENGIIIDVRANDVHQSAHIDGTVSLPLFKDGYAGVSNGSDTLAQNFIDYIQNNKTTLETKNIYILCNAGTTGAKLATKIFAAQGFKTTASSSGCDVFTIVGGATNLAVRYAFLGDNPTTPVTGEQAVEAIENDNVTILDVRTSDDYEAGHLKNSVSLPLYTLAGTAKTASDKLAKAFVTYAKASLANGDNIYIICNDGQDGSEAATALLVDAGIPLEKIHTVTNGANDEAVKAAFADDSDDGNGSGDDSGDDNGGNGSDDGSGSDNGNGSGDGSGSDDGNGSDDGSGSETDSDTTKPSGGNNSNTPVQTGDSANIIPCLIAMILSLFTIITIGKRKFIK